MPVELAAVGGIQSYYKGLPSAANGTLVSPCDVLTNAHAVFGDGEFPSNRTKVNFHYGQGSEGKYLTHVSGHPIAWGSGKNDGKNWVNPGNTCGNDWAVVRLNSCMLNDMPYMKPASVDLNKAFGPDLIEVGTIYEGLYVGGYRVDAACNISGYQSADGVLDGSEFVHDCADAEGASGAPLIMKINGTPRMIAMDCAATGPETGRAIVSGVDPNIQNLATPIEFFAKALKETLRSEESYVNRNSTIHWTEESSWSPSRVVPTLKNNSRRRSRPIK